MKKRQTEHDETLAEQLNAEQYHALPPEQQSLYRPVPLRAETLPLYAKIFFACGAMAVSLLTMASFSPSFADFFNQTVGQFFRRIYAAATSWIPFSLAELILLCLPVALIFLLRYAIRHYGDTWRSSLIFLASILSCAALLFSVFCVNFGLGYQGASLSKKLQLTQAKVSSDDLYDTALILAEAVNRDAASLSFVPNASKGEELASSVMPYSFDELNDKLIAAYDIFCKDHDFISNFDSRLKPVMFSEAMSYTHITGVYSFFTGEANINVAFPDYTIPYTAAHELAHQRGVAREDEANMVAFLVCIGSDDAYIRYSAELNMFEYVVNALYSADKAAARRAYAALDETVRAEENAYSYFFDKYASSPAATVSDAINDTYLKSVGTAGSKSYGMVVDLTVAYYKTARQ